MFHTIAAFCTPSHRLLMWHCCSANHLVPFGLSCWLFIKGHYRRSKYTGLNTLFSIKMPYFIIIFTYINSGAESIGENRILVLYLSINLFFEPRISISFALIITSFPCAVEMHGSCTSTTCSCTSSSSHQHRDVRVCHINSAWQAANVVQIENVHTIKWPKILHYVTCDNTFKRWIN